MCSAETIQIFVFLCLCVVHLCSYRCVPLPVGALCHETGRQRCWMRPERLGWLVGGPPYGTGASCPSRSPWTSRTARCGGTTGPEIKTHRPLLQKTVIRSHNDLLKVLMMKATSGNHQEIDIFTLISIYVDFFQVSPKTIIRCRYEHGNWF